VVSGHCAAKAAFSRGFRFKIASGTNGWRTILIRHLKSISSTGTLGVQILVALLSGRAVAQTTAAELPGVSATTMLQTVLGLAVVIGVLFLAAYLLRKLNGGRGFGSHGPLRVVGGLMLGARERIVLVEVGDTWLIVGLVPGQIRTLHTLPKGELKATGEGDRLFAQWLKQIVERKSEGG
jgi:flagellar protein FliO/FliZ